MKRDPGSVFTCATCKRTRPRGERDAGRNVCADRQDCRAATALWLEREAFAQGASLPGRW